MPIIQVNLLEGRSVAQKRAMIAALTQAVVDTLGVQPESVRILLNEMAPEHYAVAGTSAGERPLHTRANGHAAAHAGNGKERA